MAMPREQIIRSYRDLEVWQRSVDLAIESYFLRHLAIANGSVMEVETQVRLLAGLVRALKRRAARPGT